VTRLVGSVDNASVRCGLGGSLGDGSGVSFFCPPVIFVAVDVPSRKGLPLMRHTFVFPLRAFL